MGQTKTRPIDNPYAIYRSKLLPHWEWRVLKKWQSNDNKPYARWLVAAKSPNTYGDWEYGDTYVRDILVDAQAYEITLKESNKLNKQESENN